MAQSMVNFRMDSSLKQAMQETCRRMGMDMTTAFNLFAVRVTRDQKIPFEISADPFYSAENMSHLKKVTSRIDSGKAKLEEHELIEV